MPDVADLVNQIGKEKFVYALIFLFFILLSALTVMNMLVGVLVEVVGVVATCEKEEMTVMYTKQKILSMLNDSGLDDDGDLKISRTEFESLLLLPDTARCIHEVGVDVVGLVDMGDYIFNDDQEISFPEFMEV